MTQIWPKRAIFEFSQKMRKRHFFPTPKTRLSTKNQQIAKNVKNLHFGHFGPKWPILDSFWPKWAKRKFFNKALGTFFLRLQALTDCKVSEKSNERFSSNSVTYARTHGRESLGLQRLRRETKKWSKYRFKQPKCIVLGTPKKPEKGQE